MPNANSSNNPKVKITKYTFRCLDCKKSFDLQSEEEDVTKVFPKMCPFCGALKEKGKLEWQFSPVTIVDDKEKRRKANREHNKEVAQQAAEFARNAPREEMVTVTGPPGRFSNGTEQVPKKAVDDLTQQLMPK